MNNTEFMIPENFAVIEADKLKQECEDTIKTGKRNLTFNFRHCNFIDSTGLGVLVSIYKRCKENGGHIELTHVNNKNVLKVFELTRLNEVFNI